MEPGKLSPDSPRHIVYPVTPYPDRGRNVFINSVRESGLNDRNIDNKTSHRLSPILSPTPTSPRLYSNNNNNNNTKRSSPVRQHLESNVHELDRDDSSLAIDSVMKSNRHTSFTNSISPPRSPGRRTIFSPMPDPDDAEERSENATNYVTSGSSTPISYTPTLPNLNQEKRRASDIVFPSIKVDSYCEDCTPNTARNEKRAHSFNDLALSVVCKEQGANRDQRKCLMVPPTLIRTRSTDGRLMVGVKDRTVFPHFPTLSKAWSKSEGNIFSGITDPERLQVQGAMPSKSNEIKPEDTKFQFEEFIGGKTYNKLDPINKGQGVSNNSTTPREHNTGFPFSSTSKQLIGSPRNDNSRIESESDSFLPRNRPTLSVTEHPVDSPQIKTRSKSFSPRRHQQTDIGNNKNTQTYSNNEKSREDRVEGFKDEVLEEQFKRKIRFLSPQPRRKLTPISRNEMGH